MAQFANHTIARGVTPHRAAVKVLKFGGTSVGQADRVREVVRIIRRAAASQRVVVVASAASGVTDTLTRALDGPPAPFSILRKYLFTRYALLAQGVLGPAGLIPYTRVLEDVLHPLARRWAQHIASGPTPAFRDEVLAVGERLSVPLLVLALREAGVAAVNQDAARLIRTDDTHEAARVRCGPTHRNIKTWYATLRPETVPVVTGFIGAGASGQTTTLGRGGSDYTAALLAASLGAAVVERWTDVDGLYTADPRTTPGAEHIETLQLERAQVWNEAGKLGMHRHTLEPLIRAGIPLHVRSTLAPERPGTFLMAVA